MIFHLYTIVSKQTTMKVLLDDGINTGIVFKAGTTNEEICKWVGNNLGFTSLNEAHSCEATLDEMQEDVIVISGDEDRKEIDILPFTFIN